MIDLQQVTTRFSKAYAKNKQARVWLDKQQRRMFTAFDEALAEQQLAQKSVYVPVNIVEDEVQAWLKERYPAWRWTGTLDHGYAVIEEDPALKKFRYVNPITKEVIGRDMVEGSPMLDDEALQIEEPELWESISEWPEPWFGLVKDTVRQFTSLHWSDDAVESSAGAILSEHGVKRVIIDPARMTNEDLAAIQPYLSPGKVSTRLSPPREVKDEELDNA